MILSDKEIKNRAYKENMISPFVNRQIDNREYGTNDKRRVVSYGLSSYGYDIRLGNNFKIFTNAYSLQIDPKNFDPMSFVDAYVNVVGDHILIPPNSFVLSSSLEYIRIPRDILAICLGKSTYARCGIVVNVTPLEPEWHGNITIEISNTTPLPARIYAGEGICQLVFLKGPGCEWSYADKGGRYQGQTEVTLPFV